MCVSSACVIMSKDVLLFDRRCLSMYICLQASYAATAHCSRAANLIKAMDMAAVGSGPQYFCSLIFCARGRPWVNLVRDSRAHTRSSR